jgi:PadR family transcriptional regulator PadR
MTPRLEVMQGTLDMLIMKALKSVPQHGYGIARWIEDMTEDVLSVEEGSLYPALHRLERGKLVAAKWGVSENNRKAKFYRLTPRGRARLRAQVSDWGRFTKAVALVLEAR